MFKEIGYFEEYYVDSKFIGTRTFRGKTAPGTTIGYESRIKILITEKLILDAGKSIKAGTEVTRFIYPLNGSSNNTKNQQNG